MTSDVSVRANGELAAQQQGMSREQIQLLKDTICKGATDEELRLFAEVCKRKNLDPFSKQIHPVKRWDSTLRRETMTFQTGIDGFRIAAERTGKYAGQEYPLWCGSDGKWVDVWLSQDPPSAAKVAVIRSDFRAPMVGIALYHEYVQTTKEGTPNSMWRKMPANQLAKCAEALALRKAFPEELSGLYTSEEMGQADNPSPPTPTQRAVADAKIEQMKAGVPYAQTTVPLPIPETEQVPDAVTQMWTDMKNIASVCNIFARLKARLVDVAGASGEAEYYAILANFGGGAKHSNELKQKAAKQCAWKLYTAIERAIIEHGDVPEFDEVPEQIGGDL